MVGVAWYKVKIKQNKKHCRHGIMDDVKVDGLKCTNFSRYPQNKSKNNKVCNLLITYLKYCKNQCYDIMVRKTPTITGCYYQFVNAEIKHWKVIIF